jgi:hypothetical protein
MVCRVRAGFLVDDQTVGTGLGKGGQVTLRLNNHQVHI